MRDDLLSHVAGRSAKQFGQRHGDVAGEVTMLGVAGALHVDRNGATWRQSPVTLQRVNAICQQSF